MLCASWMNKMSDRKRKMGAAQTAAAIGLGAPAVQYRCRVQTPLAGLYLGKDARAAGAHRRRKRRRRKKTALTTHGQ